MFQTQVVNVFLGSGVQRLPENAIDVAIGYFKVGRELLYRVNMNIIFVYIAYDLGGLTFLPVIMGKGVLLLLCIKSEINLLQYLT